MTKKPARSKAPLRSKASRLQRLTAAESAILTHILNSIAFENYGDCCSTEEIAKAFDRTPARLNTTLEHLAEKGYLTIEGRIFPTAYPTALALRKQDPRLSQADAELLLRRLHRA
jgi:hypothetical protein